MASSLNAAPFLIATLTRSQSSTCRDSLATVCAGDDVSRKKPDPAVYLLAAERCGVPPENCLVLEDTGHGLRAALGAGMACVATPSELALDDDFTGAHLLRENLGEVGLETLQKVHAEAGAA